MKKHIFTTIIFASVLFLACQKDTIWVYYNETSCLDKWGVANVPDNEKTVQISQTDFLAGIYYVKMTLTDKVVVKKVVIQK